jgi:hypothetical protein
MTLQRLRAPGSDLQGPGWLETVEGLSEIALQHLYRANGFLAEVREDLEQELFARDRDLFSQELDLVFEAGENLKVKEVLVGDRRYIICLNEEEERKDETAREAILDHLREKLSGGAKSLVADKGYARYLRVTKGAMRIDEDMVAAEARYDGKYVLRTNTELPAADVAQTYKSLWRMERAFRETKSTLEARPIFHYRDDMSIGHIVAGFLALRLEVDLQRRLDDRGIDVSWPTLMRDLGRVQAVRLEADGQFNVLRTDLQGTAHQAFLAAGVQPPSPVTMTDSDERL